MLLQTPASQMNNSSWGKKDDICLLLIFNDCFNCKEWSWSALGLGRLQGYQSNGCSSLFLVTKHTSYRASEIICLMLQMATNVPEGL